MVRRINEMSGEFTRRIPRGRVPVRGTPQRLRSTRGIRAGNDPTGDRRGQKPFPYAATVHHAVADPDAGGFKSRNRRPIRESARAHLLQRCVAGSTPLQLIDRLATLIPPQRVHRHLYFGVAAPNSPLCQAVTPWPARVQPSPRPPSSVCFPDYLRPLRADRRVSNGSAADRR